MEIVLDDFGLEWKRKDGIVYKADYDDLINSYEKQMPKKVFECEENKFSCPECGSTQIDRYCAKCGQAIDW